ncbi:MAG: sigma-54 dependent transcriptional regulator [Thermodesulfovibrio sp.]|uniref:sigma-54 interaction domain-containing protein n=1 Tax=unclassified Thermodesulfovibrio TaxID=2645936 RepID=UPI000856937B|nr:MULTISPECIES: sigma-54 dependent transcriptional regulator [unclassified Thermodesulfovibrio]MDI1470929.1 sigma-54 dependent transcriptional regulator [Thermodesulfovibrio sp. 1176]MDI6713779.1 sigma-54 dependent transcriptional regulator [Thermodesulfovibrio sp.]ODA45149.1 Response regulator of zinc sigma-54-dependent two-component system [Thermodesulfovibrio sp. N1]
MIKETEFIGQSPAIKEILAIINKLSKTDSTVLIMGESGTGKELVAKMIHQKSTRATKPFIPVNCGAIPSELLESELFGHEKGAFTGAVYSRPGRFELAHEGTIFLDEIGDMPLHLQVKILRVIQERCFERIGSTKPLHVNVRIIAATNKNLENEVKEGKFREDLYWRLNVVPLLIPPLRERKEDIPILCEYFINKFSEKFGYTLKIKSDAFELLLNYHWPGNVRELENLIERLYVLSENGVITVNDLPERIKFSESFFSRNIIPEELNPFASSIDLNEVIKEYEKKLILHALNLHGWVKSRAAKYLRINRTTLIEKMKRLGIKDVEIN